MHLLSVCKTDHSIQWLLSRMLKCVNGYKSLKQLSALIISHNEVQELMVRTEIADLLEVI